MAMAASKPRRKNSLSIHDARVAGLYDLEQTIGKGHFAVVKLASHVFTGEKVAVKIIDKTKLDKVSQQHIMNEVRCMKLVQHPSIVRLYEVIDTSTKLFLILELADYDMYDYLQRFSAGIPERDAQRYFAQIVDAIHYCHELHVVHRDLKPENVVFFEKLGMVKLTDFGFSNVYSPGTLLDTSCGSLAYSAPEILLGDAYDAPAVDVWSLGVILYMFVVGRLPFQEANDSETLTKILDCSYPLPDNLSDSCKQLIKRMLVREPRTRATLTDIREHDWVCGGRTDHASTLPLVGRQQLSDDDHDTIVSQMVCGGIAPAEQVHSSLDKDDYSHVTATYYLLAERVLRAEREARAQELLAQTLAKSNPELTSIGQNDVDMIEDEAGSECEQGTSGHATSAFVPLPSLSEDEPAESHSWKCQRSFSMLKEESEEELSGLVSSRRSSRAGSPNASAFRASSERSQVSPAAILDLLDISGRLSSGRRSPESRTQSRSPSPPQHHLDKTGSASIASGIISRLSNKPVVTPQMRKLSSSPHLIGICEEAEDVDQHEHTSGECALCAVHVGVKARSATGPSGPSSTSSTAGIGSGGGGLSYGSVRMIRQRQAVVNPDVIRRYERASAGNNVNRSRRSTSCSSSEASDDEGRQLAAHIGAGLARHCRGRRRGGGDGGDDDGGASGTAGGTQGGVHGARSGSGSGGSKDAAATGGQSGTSGSTAAGQQKKATATTNNSCHHAELDTGRLMGQLRQLALAPIEEHPMSLPRFLRRPMSVANGMSFFQRSFDVAGGASTHSPAAVLSSKDAWLHKLRRAKSAENMSSASTDDDHSVQRSETPGFGHMVTFNQPPPPPVESIAIAADPPSTSSQSDSAFSTQDSLTESSSNDDESPSSSSSSADEHHNHHHYSSSEEADIELDVEKADVDNSTTTAKLSTSLSKTVDVVKPRVKRRRKRRSQLQQHWTTTTTPTANKGCGFVDPADAEQHGLQINLVA